MTFSFSKVNFSLVEKKKNFQQKVDYFVTFVHMNVQNFQHIRNERCDGFDCKIKRWSVP